MVWVTRVCNRNIILRKLLLFKQVRITTRLKIEFGFVRAMLTKSEFVVGVSVRRSGYIFWKIPVRTNLSIVSLGRMGIRLSVLTHVVGLSASSARFASFVLFAVFIMLPHLSVGLCG